MHLISAIGQGHWVRSWQALGGCSRWVISYGRWLTTGYASGMTGGSVNFHFQW